MKKLLLIIGIVIIIAGVIALLFSALNRFGYYHLLDGSPELYVSLHRKMLIHLAGGIILVAIGAVCLIIRTKM